MFGTALPNLHPAIIHFPIALLVVGLGFDMGCLVFRRQAWLDRSAATLLGLGAIGAWVAVLTGEQAADSLLSVPAHVQPLIAEHHDWAVWTARIFSLIALVRVALAWADLGAKTLSRVPVRAVVLAGAFAGQLMLLGTADRGGALVFEHGLAVAARAESEARSTEESEVSVEIAEPPSARLIREADGTLTWTPLPEDAGAIGSVITLVEGSTPVQAAPGEAGLGLAVTGRSMLVLPGEFSNVQVEATLDVSGFRGTVCVVHHVRNLQDAGAFELSTDGEARLVSAEAGHRKTLDQGEWTPSGEAITLAVSAAGRHLKGILNGATVTHGHEEASDPGSVGLLLDGEGIVRIHSLRAIPLEGH